ncbi:ankyrin repeat domain-containing protein [Archangium sp.]|uniref:ankyrin repeat domain-containing protein n=1 Tax=Archangium sp. TaxID=1872627 RepID=UPI002D39A75E|nr:ankyrin repeat domain-containing protein [Archangium sp.]HYO59353.1 ankyrin repeat domain-containing protein [Archangium sp.]
MSKELFEAIEKHDVGRLARLLMEGADPNALKAGWPEWLPLHAAVDELEEGGPVEALVLLLRHGARVDGLGPDRTATALLMAIFRRQPEAVRILLAAGADPNYRGSEGDSPLRACVEQGDLAMAAMLLRCGATRTIDEGGGPSGMSALGRAANRLDIPMLELLLRAGADPDALDMDRQTARERLPPREPHNQEAWDAAAALLAGRSRG